MGVLVLMSLVVEARLEGTAPHSLIPGYKRQQTDLLLGSLAGAQGFI